MKKWLFGFAVIALAAVWITGKQNILDIEDQCEPVGGFEDNIHFVQVGKGPAVVLIHGAGANLNDYLASHIIDDLKKDHTVYALDRPGSGHSSAENWTEGSFNEYQVEEILEFLTARQIQKPILIGHSLGAAVAAAVAARLEDQVGGLILVAGAVYPIGTGASWYTYAATLPGINWIFNNLILPHVGPQMVNSILRKNFSPNPVPKDYDYNSCLSLLFEPQRFKYNAYALNEIVPFMQSQLENYPKIGGPISLIYGAEDKVIATHVHSREFKKIHPRARMHMLDNVGHLPHHSHQVLIRNEIQRMIRQSDEP